ncbi:MAG: tRNA (N(6)-L-threonylcarbamoyladenosine(37)-C(2))-methylthiotransferase [Candidatus Bathyarchaeia archaeon]
MEEISSITLNIGGKAETAAKAIYIESYGCAANKADLEIMLAHIVNAGYKIINRIEDADIIMINTCGVKKPTEDRMLGRIRFFNGLNKPLIIAGCLPKINFEAVTKAAPNFSAMLDPYSIDKILLALKAAESGERNKIFFSEKPIVKPAQPKIRLNRVIEIIPISEGCLGVCTYCCVRFARGRLFSYPKELIVDRIKSAIIDGAKEIWLTSQDNGAYGADIGTNFVELLKECSSLEGKFLIRVGMMNPNHVIKMLPELIETYKNERIFKFLHIPVQSGDNDVLKMMNRKYTVEEFKSIVESFRREIPEITIATDIICGFPGESRESFERTLQLIEDVKPDIINISKFFPRPNTPAARMKQLDSREVAVRSRVATDLVSRISLKMNMRWIGWEGEILVDEKGPGDSWIGRNYAYKPIVVRSQKNLLGEFINVKVTEAHVNYLEAEII